MKKIILVTHNNRFHADDVLATATLLLALKKGRNDVQIIRTQDKNIINSGDYVYDVGGIYDEEKNCFDHHQEDFNEKRKNGIFYSSFGLVWKKFGEQICGSSEVSNILDKKIVRSVDALDNGISLCESKKGNIYPYTIGDMMSAFNPSWPEKKNIDDLFFEVVDIAKRILEREVLKAQDIVKVEKILKEIYNKTKDKRIIFLEENYPWEDILDKYKEPLFVIKPRDEEKWSVKAVPLKKNSFDRRKYFPENWAGKMGDELAEITGVKDAVFCHRGRFICVAKSKEGAMELAKLSLK